MDGIVVPTWLAQAMAAGIGSQFVAVVWWMHRQDKARDVADIKTKGAIDAISLKLDGLAALLTEHNPVRRTAEAEALGKRVDAVEVGVRAHHKLLRHLQRRMDLGHVAEVDADGDGD